MRNVFGFMDDLTDREKRFTNKSIVTRNYSKGSIINRNEDGCVGLLAVESGQLRVYIVSDSGREVTLFRVEAGEICVLSVSCLLDSIVFDVVIEAATDVTTKIIPAGVIHKLEADNPKVGLFLYKTATEKFSEVMWTMQQILFMKLDSRIAVFLWDEINRIDEDEILITHDMIANQIGSSREAVTRVMKYFDKEVILKPKRGKVIVCDRAGLKNMAYPSNVT